MCLGLSSFRQKAFLSVPGFAFIFFILCSGHPSWPTLEPGNLFGVVAPIDSQDLSSLASSREIALVAWSPKSAVRIEVSFSEKKTARTPETRGPTRPAVNTSNAYDDATTTRQTSASCNSRSFLGCNCIDVFDFDKRI